MIESRPNMSILSINLMENSPIKGKKTVRSDGGGNERYVLYKKHVKIRGLRKLKIKRAKK